MCCIMNQFKKIYTFGKSNVREEENSLFEKEVIVLGITKYFHIFFKNQVVFWHVVIKLQIFIHTCA